MTFQFTRHPGRWLAATAMGVVLTSAAAVVADPFASDLDIFLTHGNTTIQLFQGAQDDTQGLFNVTFDDESVNPHTGSLPIPTEMQPLQLLSNFDGQDLSGTWTLGIQDTFVPNEGDELVGWRIFGTLVGNQTFNFDGPGAFNVDSDPATEVSLFTALQGEIADINVQLEIVGNVPEPAMLGLFGMGLASLALMRRRRNRDA